MKKMKALFLTLALMLTVGLTATGCDKIKGFFDKGSSESSVEEGFGEATGIVPIVTLDKTEASIYQYESFQLFSTTKWTNEKVVYTSSDESVATVDENGNVVAKDKIGQVKITATAGDVSAYCTVTVEKSPYHPQIVVNATNYTLEEGNTLEFTVTTEWNKTELSEELEYTVSFAENSQNAKAAISIEGNVIKVAADTEETFNIVVSTTARGLYTSQQLTVTVIKPTLKLLPMGVAFQPDSGLYTVDVSATDLAGDLANSIPLNVVAMKAGRVLEGVEIDWTLEGDAVAIEEGNLVGKMVGKASLTATAEYEGETTTLQLVCNVLPVELTLDEAIILDLQETNLTFTLQSQFIGTLESAEYDGVTVSSRVRGQTIAFDATKFPTTSKKLGRQELTLHTSVACYTMPIEIYTMIINDKDELDQMRILANTGEMEYSERFQEMRNKQCFDGYFILGNDIAYNKTITSMTDTGSVWGVQGYETDDRGFIGVFDGCGYNIDGVTVGNHPSGDKKQAGGIFGYLATGGVVKNVSFTNAVVLANNGFICSRGNGTIENVSVQYKKLGGDKETSGINSATTRTMGTFFSYAAGPQATVKNCLVDASAADIGLEFGLYNGAETMNVCLVGKAVNVENTIALCPDTRVLDKSGADIKVLTYSDLIADSELLQDFDPTYWTTVDGVPMMVNQAEKLNRDIPVDFLNVKSSLVAGFSMLILANNPYTRIELSPVEGVTFENSILSATEEAFTKTVILKVVSLFNAENFKTIEVYIDSFGEAVEAPTTEEVVVDYENPYLTIGDNSWMGEENYVYIGADIYSIGDGADGILLDWKAYGWEKKEATIVTVKEGVRTHFDVNMKVGYTAKALSESVKVAETVFGTARKSSDGQYVLVDVAADIAAPEGYENVSRLDSNTNWGTALERQFFNKMDLSAYKEIWFGMKIVNGGWVFRSVDELNNVTGWVYFHYIQIEEGVWIAEIYNGAQLYLTVFKVVGNNLQSLTYRDGWSNGFLLYNNNGRRPEGKTTQIYATEIRGVLKDAE